MAGKEAEELLGGDLRHFFVVLVLPLFLLACAEGTQEECRADSAREATTDQALAILIQECYRKYPAVQLSDGTFSLHVPDLGRSVEVSGATPTDEDREMIAALIEEKRTRDAEMARERFQRISEANSQLRIIDLGITCQSYCVGHNAHFTIENGSNSQIAQVAIQYELGANVSCQGNYSKSIAHNIIIPPGEVGSAELELPYMAYRGRRHCIKLDVTEVW